MTILSTNGNINQTHKQNRIQEIRLIIHDEKFINEKREKIQKKFEELVNTSVISC